MILMIIWWPWLKFEKAPCTPLFSPGGEKEGEMRKDFTPSPNYPLHTSTPLHFNLSPSYHITLSLFSPGIFIQSSWRRSGSVDKNSDGTLSELWFLWLNDGHDWSSKRPLVHCSPLGERKRGLCGKTSPLQRFHLFQLHHLRVLKTWWLA